MFAVGAFLVAGSCQALGAKPPAPVKRIALSDLGFPGYRVALMHAGASMVTLHLLDKDHLLFTFGLRGLVPRLPGDDANDQDRLVGAEIVEISTGKVLDRTEWHLHDHGRYLWSLGHGMFMLRSGDELSTFVPLRGLASHTSFQRVALPHHGGHPELISASPDGNVVTVQIQKKPEQNEDGSGDVPKLRHTVVEFYRLLEPRGSDGPVEIKAAGVLGSPGLLRLALDGDGYLWADSSEADHYRWSVSFNEFEGKAQNLLKVDSSCSPRMELLSRSEFAVLSCRGSDDAQMLSTYGFDGQLNWQMPLGGESLQPPSLVSAGEAGRFAMSRLLASSSGLGGPSHGGPQIVGDSTLSQVIRVYTITSGDPLLSVTSVPAERTPENFDLSPDGRTLAVLSADTIDLYTLPGLSEAERKDLADARTMTPPAASGPVVLRRIARPIVAEEQPIAGEETTAPVPAPTAAPALKAPATQASATQASATQTTAQTPPANAAKAKDAQPSGDDGTSGRRKPPTLLAPGEKPDNAPKGQGAPPQ